MKTAAQILGSKPDPAVHTMGPAASASSPVTQVHPHQTSEELEHDISGQRD